MQRFYSHGKLLLTGEYAVLNGAKALAVPCKFGQDLQIQLSNDQTLHWKSYSVEGECWLAASYPYELIKQAKNEQDDLLLRVLQEAHRLNPELLNQANGYEITTYLEFPRDWGLGSSSTFIANIAQWFQVDPYALLKISFGGSGYDLACALSDMPLLYQLKEEVPHVQKVYWNPQWVDKTYFVHLNQKQNSRESIAQFQKQTPEKQSELVPIITKLTDELLQCHSLESAQQIVLTHEKAIASTLGMQRLQDQLFPDFPGVIKSLGGWGGDFVWVISPTPNQDYFSKKGYKTIISYNDLVK